MPTVKKDITPEIGIMIPWLAHLSWLRKPLVHILIVCGLTPLISCSRPDHDVDLVISNINIVDVVRGEVVPNCDILIDGGKIKNVCPAGVSNFTYRQGIDGRNQYVIPGLWDMHVHTGNADVFFPLYIANGVTGVRDMGGGLEISTGNLSVKFDKLSLWRDEVRRGDRIGPEILLAGAMIDGTPTYWPGNIGVTDSASIHRAVRAQKELGVDFIKIYHNLTSQQLIEIANEVKNLGMSFAGHLPIGSPPYETLVLGSELGQSSIEHMFDLPMAITREPVSVNSYMDVTVAYRDAIKNIDLHKAEKLFGIFRKNGTWFTPTVSGKWGIGQLDLELDETLQNWLCYIPRHILDYWGRDPFQDKGDIRHPPEDYQTFRDAADNTGKLAKLMYDNGVLLMAGSDAANVMTIPGFGLHNELFLLCEAGFTPAEALRLATINPARFLKRTDIGIIANNCSADLVILNANPLTEIKNLSDIDAVVLKGNYLSRKYLNEMLDQVKMIVSSK